MADKLPALQFYPGDWRKDVGVQSLAYHDRGVWFEILMLMHESQPRGMLLLNGKPMAKDALGRLLGLDNQRLKQTLSNLLTSGVATIDEDTGALMNRRMVRDENLRQIRKEAGKKGGNPLLLNQNPTTQDKQIPTPSSSSSNTNTKTTDPDGSSGDLETTKKKKRSSGQGDEDIERVRQAYPLKKAPGAARKAIEKAIVRVAARGESDPVGFLIGRIAEWKAARERDTAAGRFVSNCPYPATWFNEERYDEEGLQPAKNCVLPDGKLVTAAELEAQTGWQVIRGAL